MSVWTHVLASFRIDGFRSDEDYDIEDKIKRFDKVIGKELLLGANLNRADFDNFSDYYDAVFDQWDKEYEEYKKDPSAYLPLGSEGSLRKSVWVNPDVNHIASYVVTVFGDLRDHYNIEEIEKWFKDTCEGLWIRQATCTIYNYLHPPKSITYIAPDEYIECEAEEF